MEIKTLKLAISSFESIFEMIFLILVLLFVLKMLQNFKKLISNKNFKHKKFIIFLCKFFKKIKKQQIWRISDFFFSNYLKKNLKFYLKIFRKSYKINSLAEILSEDVMQPLSLKKCLQHFQAFFIKTRRQKNICLSHCQYIRKTFNFTIKDTDPHRKSPKLINSNKQERKNLPLNL